MEFVFEPWHWFVLGVLLMLSELVLPAFAALWFGIGGNYGRIFYWMFPMMGLTTPDCDLDYFVDSLHFAVV